MQSGDGSWEGGGEALLDKQGFHVYDTRPENAGHRFLPGILSLFSIIGGREGHFATGAIELLLIPAPSGSIWPSKPH